MTRFTLRESYVGDLAIDEGAGDAASIAPLVSPLEPTPPRTRGGARQSRPHRAWRRGWDVVRRLCGLRRALAVKVRRRARLGRGAPAVSHR